MLRFNRRVLVVVAVVAVIGGASYAFLAALSGLPVGTHAGAGTVAVSGYAVSDLSYTYDTVTPDPDAITNVEFTLDDDAGVVSLQLTGGGTWYACSKNVVLTAGAGGSNTVWDCDSTVGTQATVTAQDEIDIVAHT